jgi:hypothetical protein
MKLGWGTPSSIWRLAFKRVATYPTVYPRSKNVVRKSRAVKAINRSFTAAAKECKGKPLGEFNSCIAEKLVNTHAEIRVAA